MEIEAFLYSHQKIGSECTRKVYRTFLRRFAVFLHNHGLRREEVRSWHIREFITEIKRLGNDRTGEHEVSDTTVQSHLAAVSSYYKWLQERGIETRNPVGEMKFRRTQKPRKVEPVSPSVADAICSGGHGKRQETPSDCD